MVPQMDQKRGQKRKRREREEREKRRERARERKRQRKREREREREKERVTKGTFGFCFLQKGNSSVGAKSDVPHILGCPAKETS